MIPRAFIDAWRSHAPWRSDAQVEQDLIVCRVVTEIFRHPVLSQRLVFRGGTALHKLYFTPSRRYSEDVDLVQSVLDGAIAPAGTDCTIDRRNPSGAALRLLQIVKKSPEVLLTAAEA